MHLRRNDNNTIEALFECKFRMFNNAITPYNYEQVFTIIYCRADVQFVFEGNIQKEGACVYVRRSSGGMCRFHFVL